MEKRGIIIHPEELTDQMIGLLAKTDVNVLGLHPRGGRAADKTLEELLGLMKTDDFQIKLAQVRALGIAVEYEMHALAWLLPRDLFESHPDWFRVDQEGNRVNDFNMCVSNLEALEYLSKRAQLLAELLPSDTGRYYFWSDDVDGTFCNCEKCRSLSPSDQAMIIYNAILAGVRRADPDAKQCFLAYHETITPPRSVRPAEGIFLEYAPMRRTTQIPIFDRECEDNRKLCDAIPALLDWFGTKDAQILDYWMDNSMFSNWVKPPKELYINTETIRGDMAYYQQCGFVHITSFGCFLSDDYIALYGEPPMVEYGKCFAILNKNKRASE